MKTKKNDNHTYLDASYLVAAFDTLTDQIAIINQTAEILFVNKAWELFGEENNARKNIKWVGKNYLHACTESNDETNTSTGYIKQGLEEVLKQNKVEFITEYPCDSPTIRRWFSMRVALLGEFTPPLFLVSHHDITKRKNLEEEALKLSLCDNLTGLSNRKHFLNILHKEWNRAICSQKTLALVLIDVDQFSELAEEYGNLIGDECLAQLGMLISDYCNPELEVAARFTTEQFGLLLIDTDESRATQVAESIRSKVMNFTFPRYLKNLTISCGVSTIKPQRDLGLTDLLNQSVKALNEAKKLGGNRSVVYVTN